MDEDVIYDWAKLCWWLKTVSLLFVFQAYRNRYLSTAQFFQVLSKIETPCFLEKQAHTQSGKVDWVDILYIKNFLCCSDGGGGADLRFNVSCELAACEMFPHCGLLVNLGKRRTWPGCVSRSCWKVFLWDSWSTKLKHEPMRSYQCWHDITSDKLCGVFWIFHKVNWPDFHPKQSIHVPVYSLSTAGDVF